MDDFLFITRKQTSMAYSNWGVKVVASEIARRGNEINLKIYNSIKKFPSGSRGSSQSISHTTLVSDDRLHIPPGPPRNPPPISTWHRLKELRERPKLRRTVHSRGAKQNKALKTLLISDLGPVQAARLRSWLLLLRHRNRPCNFDSGLGIQNSNTKILREALSHTLFPTPRKPLAPVFLSRKNAASFANTKSPFAARPPAPKNLFVAEMTEMRLAMADCVCA